MNQVLFNRVSDVIQKGKRMERLSNEYNKVSYLKRNLENKDISISELFASKSTVENITGMAKEDFIEQLRDPMLKMCDRIEEDLITQINEI